LTPFAQQESDMAERTTQTLDGNMRLITHRSEVPGEAFRDEILATLTELLMSVGKDHIQPHLVYCVREILDNAVRANLKRLYFETRGLDLRDPAAYDRGLKAFKSEVSENFTRWLEQCPQRGYAVTVEFHVAPEQLSIFVVNNAVLLPNERQRIYQRLDKARIYESMAEILEEISDDSESAGLGIVMMYMILRSLGLPESSFVVREAPDHTRVGVVVPLAALTDEESQTVSEALAQEIKAIPQFPAHILELRKILTREETNFQDVAVLVRRDPALTAEVLRMCNSAFYRRRDKVESTPMAVNILGIRGLLNILCSFGARQALAQQYPNQSLDRLWGHSTQVADATSFLCARYSLSREETEQAYNGALLHEIGRIVLEGRHPETCRALEALCQKKAVSVNAVEDLVEGVNHTMISAALATKWELPESIVQTLKFYRTPRSADDIAKKTASVVHLAHSLTDHLQHEAGEYHPDTLPALLDLHPRDTLVQLLADWRPLVP
jgi:HD-like signal output (HDOD) protein